MTDLRDVHVSSVSLGKAHAIVLTNKGQVYSFGINNKGQCGRDFLPQVNTLNPLRKQMFYEILNEE